MNDNEKQAITELINLKFETAELKNELDEMIEKCDDILNS